MTGRVERGLFQQFRCWPRSRPDFRRGQEMKQEWTPVQVENRITGCTLTSSDLYIDKVHAPKSGRATELRRPIAACDSLERSGK